MDLSRIAHVPLAAVLAVVIAVGMPALARLQPKPADDPWLKMRPPLEAVAGTLLFEGRPVEGAIVTFVSLSRDREEDREFLAVSSTGPSGRFWLRTFTSQGDGAIPGMHRVSVKQLVPTGRMMSPLGPDSPQGAVPLASWLDQDAAQEEYGGDTHSLEGIPAFAGVMEMVNVLPERFADERTSGLVAEVVAGDTNEFLIHLRAEPPQTDPGS